MNKWEYYDTTVNYHGGSLEDYLNEIGEEGWELIKIFDSMIETIEDKELVIRGRFLFKRKIKQENGNKGI